MNFFILLICVSVVSANDLIDSGISYMKEIGEKALKSSLDYVKDITRPYWKPTMDAGKKLSMKVLDMIDKRQTLMVAAATGDMALAEEQLKMHNVDMENDDKQTALMLASEFGQLKMVIYLISGGANMDHVDRNGNTALILASKNGHTDIVKHLVASGANVHHKDADNNDAIDYATQNGDSDTARYIGMNGSGILKNKPTETVLLCALIYALKIAIEQFS